MFFNSSFEFDTQHQTKSDSKESSIFLKFFFFNNPSNIQDELLNIKLFQNLFHLMRPSFGIEILLNHNSLSFSKIRPFIQFI